MKYCWKWKWSTFNRLFLWVDVVGVREQIYFIKCITKWKLFIFYCICIGCAKCFQKSKQSMLHCDWNVLESESGLYFMAFFVCWAYYLKKKVKAIYIFLFVGSKNRCRRGRDVWRTKFGIRCQVCKAFVNNPTHRWPKIINTKANLIQI